MYKSDFLSGRVCEKFLAKGMDVFCASMDLEKSYDRVDREALGWVLHVHTVKSTVDFKADGRQLRTQGSGRRFADDAGNKNVPLEANLQNMLTAVHLNM